MLAGRFAILAKRFAVYSAEKYSCFGTLFNIGIGAKKSWSNS